MVELHAHFQAVYLMIKMIDLKKFTMFYRKNPLSSDTNIKVLTEIQNREKINTKEKIEKINKYIEESDKKIAKMKAERGIK